MATKLALLKIIFSDPILIKFRSFLRKIGVLNIFKIFINFNNDYELKFKNELKNTLKENMVVFDIGARSWYRDESAFTRVFRLTYSRTFGGNSNKKSRGIDQNEEFGRVN